MLNCLFCTTNILLYRLIQFSLHNIRITRLQQEPFLHLYDPDQYVVLHEGQRGCSNGLGIHVWLGNLLYLVPRACFSLWLYQEVLPGDMIWSPTGSEAVNPLQSNELSGFSYQGKLWGILSTLGMAVPQLLPPLLQASMWCCPIVFCNLGEKRKADGRTKHRWDLLDGAEELGQSSCAKVRGAYHLGAGTFGRKTMKYFL